MGSEVATRGTSRMVVLARPNATLRDAIESYCRRHKVVDHAPTPSPDLHCTLWSGDVRPECHSAAVKKFTALTLLYAHTQTGFLELFNESELMLKLNAYPRVRQLHMAVAEAMASIAEDASAPALYASKPAYERWKNEPYRWDAAKKYGKPYFGRYFQPHITLGTLPEPLRDSKALANYNFPIDEVILIARQGSNPWEELATNTLV